MRRRTWLAAALIAWPVAAAEPAPAPEPEFLEFLATAADEDDGFDEYLMSRDFDRELRRAEAQRKAVKDDKDER